MRVTPRLAPFALLAACASARGSGACPAPGAAVAAQSASRVAPAEALVARVREVEQQTRGAGVRLAGLVAHGFISHQASVTTAVDVPENGCLALVALGSTGLRDLDAHLFDPAGDLLVEDVETDPHPTVQICTTAARRVYHVLDAYEGNGAFAVAAFVADRAGLAEVARAMGGQAAMAVGTGGERSEIERRMNELRDGIARRGFQPVGGPTRSDFAAAGARRVPVPVTPDRCYTFAAVADGEVRDADLVVYDAAGDAIARDVRDARDATVQLCPPVAATLAVEVRARSGPGVVALQAYQADAASLGGANALWLGERLAWEARAEPLAQTAPAAVARLAAAGYVPGADRLGRGVTAVLGPGESREETVEAPAGRCTAVAAFLGRGVAGARVEVFDARGELVARGPQRGGAAVAVVCPPAAETLRAALTATTGQGEAMVRTFQNAAQPAWIAGVDRVAVSEALADAWARTDGAWRAEGTPEKVRVGAGARRVREVERAAGQCVRWTASAGHGLPWVSVVLRGPGGDRVAAGEGEGTAVVTRCGAAAERLQLEVRTEPSTAPETDAVLSHAVRPDAPEGAP
ncbi:MAG: hypothetical protein U0324_37540 [Polyangiales bacterium]